MTLIRKMTARDYGAVYDLWLSCKGMGLNNIDDSRDGIESFLARNPDTCFVAEEDEKLVGVILAGNDGRRGYIYHTAVDPTLRRRGIASKLVDAALRALRELGIAKVALVVFERNAAGNEFWESVGFTVRNDLVYRNKVLTDIVRMDT
ncbi:MAG: Acetyltransferase YpeA [Firmicutes bacterium ADurb.Bin248]|nr:MAG: Acetyltransferase YpeA [Firmicutes bacterium ADurb.Bin248]HOG01271.1 GNAT family N-acetyltransferase [Clostridia bacterium]HPK14899.1 GNAT family N-acetyltransferase [Clostridia bacterium]